MYVVYNKDHIDNYLNEYKMITFAYNSDWRMYILLLPFLNKIITYICVKT